MRANFDNKLSELNKKLLSMAAMTEQIIAMSIKSLEEQDTKLARETVEFDAKINEAEREVERICLNLLLQQQPVFAEDLRRVEGVMSEEKMLASLNRYGRIAAQEMKRTDQAQYEMMLLSGKLMEKLMKIQTEAEEYHEKLAESLLKTWTREDRIDPYNTLEMTNLRIQADMEAQKQVMEEIIHPRIG